MAEVAKRIDRKSRFASSALLAQENGIVPALLEEMGIGSPSATLFAAEMKNLPKIADINTADPMHL